MRKLLKFFTFLSLIVHFQYALAASLTPTEQAIFDAAYTTRIAQINNSVLGDNIGNSNQTFIDQVGSNQQTITSINGSYNNTTFRQGDTISRQGQSLLQSNINGDYNTVSLNQGTDQYGISSGNDLCYHYQGLSVHGNYNTVTTSQIGYNQFESINISGNYNTEAVIQTGTAHQVFSTVSGDYNTISVTQTGPSGHFLDLSLSGPGNTAIISQSGSLPNAATISLINAGGPTGINLIQSGGQTLSIQQTCTTTTGCGIITVKQ